MEELQNKEQGIFLQDYWQELSFEGKDYFRLEPEGTLIRSSSGKHEKDRVIAVLTNENCKETIDELKQKFDDAQQQFYQLKKDWEQEEDKIRLLSAVRRYHQYLARLDGIGNFAPILQELRQMEIQLQEILAKNLAIREAIIQKAEEMKKATEIRTEDWNTLLEEWRHAPFIEKEENDRLWQQFEKARNVFYENKQERIEERNKELMQNLDWKMEVCEEAETWQNSNKWQEGTEAFKGLFERWKDIGHVPSIEKNDELWERFRRAKDNFFQRKSAHYEEIKKEQEANYEEKLKLVEEAEQLKEQRTWKITSAAFNLLMVKWKTIGKVPYEKSEEIWSRLQAARDFFYNARRESMKEIREKLEENLSIKEELAHQAQTLKDSTNWEEVTRELNHLMTIWKKTGAVPREKSDEVWEKFLSARKHFFARKDADREKRRNNFYQKLNGRIEQTIQFLKKLRAEHEEDILNLEDFKHSLKETTGTTTRDEELRAHLNGLIEGLNKSMPSREVKIKEVEHQLESLKEAKEKVEKKSHIQHLTNVNTPEKSKENTTTANNTSTEQPEAPNAIDEQATDDPQ